MTSADRRKWLQGCVSRPLIGLNGLICGLQRLAPVLEHEISSGYPGGFHAIFADGQVWFVSDEVPFDILAQFFTVAGAEQHDREKKRGGYAIDRGKTFRDDLLIEYPPSKRKKD